MTFNNEEREDKQLDKRVEERIAKAISLDLEEKAKLISSELGKRVIDHCYYPQTSLGGDFSSTTTSESYVGRPAGCMPVLKVRRFKEEFADKSGHINTYIYLRKQLILPFLHRSKRVYASETRLDRPGKIGKIEVKTFKAEDDWLLAFELMYSKVNMDKAIKDNLKAAEQALARNNEQQEKKENYGLSNQA